MQKLILASSSIYRRSLLEKLNIPFLTQSPEVDETPLSGESPAETALRLAQEKARKVGLNHDDALIIGSDQVAVLEGVQIGKPLSFENAFRQLQMMRGKTVVFHSALCLFNSKTHEMQKKIVSCDVAFRPLGDEQITRYLHIEQPYHCAGSAKTEGLGIALIQSMQGSDPNALVGLPLIALVDMLKNEGVEVI